MSQPIEMIERVRRALGRTAPLRAVPAPPQIEEPITRLVHSDIGLVELFARMARQNQMIVEEVSAGELGPRVSAIVGAGELWRVALSSCELFERIDLCRMLRAAGCVSHAWDELSLDDLYEFDVGVTDVFAAVAETGSLVVRAGPGHGRALSLVPPVHIAVVAEQQILPDLVDLFEKLASDAAAETVIITGPSKTADIEMQLVTGVHGPGKVFVLVTP